MFDGQTLEKLGIGKPILVRNTRNMSLSSCFNGGEVALITCFKSPLFTRINDDRDDNRLRWFHFQRC